MDRTTLGEANSDPLRYCPDVVAANKVPIAIKRVADLLFAALLLPLTLPLMLVATIAIRLTSQGPALFVQERAGLNGRIFNIYKLRTMVTSAEGDQSSLEDLNEADGPIFKMRRDPRVTPIGSFLRRFSIDELPQLINVLRGEMSLVGPRPHLAAAAAKYTPRERGRLCVKPGMTGLAQVNGRSKLSWGDTVALDLRYAESVGIRTDLQIIARTFGTVLSANGAT